MTTIKMSDLRNGDMIAYANGNNLKQAIGVFKVSKILPIDKMKTVYNFIGENEAVGFLNRGVKHDDEFEVVALALKPFVGISNCKGGINGLIGFVCQALKAVGQDDNASLMLIQLALSDGDYFKAVNIIKNFINYF